MLKTDDGKWPAGLLPIEILTGGISEIDLDDPPSEEYRVNPLNLFKEPEPARPFYQHSSSEKIRGKFSIHVRNNTFTITLHRSRGDLPSSINLDGIDLKKATIRAHYRCTCAVVKHHKKWLENNYFVLHVTGFNKVYTEDQRPIHNTDVFVIINSTDKTTIDIIMSALLHDSFMIRQQNRFNSLSCNYADIHTERIQSVNYCGNILRQSTELFNGLVGLIGSTEVITRIADVVNRIVRLPSVDIGGTVDKLLVYKIADLFDAIKTGGDGQKYSFPLRWYVDNLIKTDISLDLSILVGIEPYEKELEIAGGKREWYPYGVIESPAECSNRELHEEFGLCFARNFWHEHLNDTLFFTNGKGYQHAFTVIIPDTVETTVLDNSLVLLS
jgi:hypothetical protein